MHSDEHFRTSSPLSVPGGFSLASHDPGRAGRGAGTALAGVAQAALRGRPAAGDLRDRATGAVDAKATGLLQAVGLSLTVLAMMAPRLPENARGPGLWGLWVVLLLGLSTALMAIWALRVRKGEYATVNERTLFSKELLADADSHEKDKQDEAVTMFYRTTTAHLWQIVQAQERIHNAKAEWIWRGQMAFGGFLLGVLLLGFAFLGGYR